MGASAGRSSWTSRYGSSGPGGLSFLTNRVASSPADPGPDCREEHRTAGCDRPAEPVADRNRAAADKDIASGRRSNFNTIVQHFQCRFGRRRLRRRPRSGHGRLRQQRWPRLLVAVLHGAAASCGLIDRGGRQTIGAGFPPNGAGPAVGRSIWPGRAEHGLTGIVVFIQFENRAVAVDGDGDGYPLR